MKLLFDANLSRRLVAHMEDLFPGSAHVSVLGLEPEDIEIWHFAAANNFIIVTKDSDFYRMSVTWGPPPKVIWLRLGNAGSRSVVETLRMHVSELATFGTDPGAALVTIETGHLSG